MKFNHSKIRTLSLAATVLVVALPAYGEGQGIQSPRSDPSRIQGVFSRTGEERSIEPRMRRQERQGLREELRQSQRDGLSPAGFDSEYEPRAPRRMSAEERRQLRREINDAAHNLYGERHEH